MTTVRHELCRCCQLRTKKEGDNQCATCADPRHSHHRECHSCDNCGLAFKDDDTPAKIDGEKLFCWDCIYPSCGYWCSGCNHCAPEQ